MLSTEDEEKLRVEAHELCFEDHGMMLAVLMEKISPKIAELKARIKAENIPDEARLAECEAELMSDPETWAAAMLDELCRRHPDFPRDEIDGIFTEVIVAKVRPKELPGYLRSRWRNRAWDGFQADYREVCRSFTGKFHVDDMLAGILASLDHRGIACPDATLLRELAICVRDTFEHCDNPISPLIDECSIKTGTDHVFYEDLENFRTRRGRKEYDYTEIIPEVADLLRRHGVDGDEAAVDFIAMAVLNAVTWYEHQHPEDWTLDTQMDLGECRFVTSRYASARQRRRADREVDRYLAWFREWTAHQHAWSERALEAYKGHPEGATLKDVMRPDGSFIPPPTKE